jgi:uncharacterized protein DUF4352
MRRALGIGCLGLVGLVVVVVVISALLGGGGGESAGGGAGGGQNSGSKTYRVGQEVRVGDLSYTVTKAQRKTQLRDTYGIEPPLKRNFIVVDFVFPNNGDEPVTASDIGLYIYDSKGHQFETDTDASLGYIPEQKNILLLDRINPGLSKEFRVVYTVPPDAKGFEVEVTSGLLASDTARIDLGL